jgi:hypothetical protein
LDNKNIPLEDKIVWRDAITWGTIEDNFDDNEAKFYNKLPVQLKEKMYEDNKRSMSNGMQCGFMNDQDCVIKTCISDCDLFDVINGAPVSFTEDGVELAGLVIDYDIESGTVEVKVEKESEEKGIYAEQVSVGIDKLTFVTGDLSNELLEYDIDELLLAILRKAAIVRLASKGSPINQVAVDSLALSMINDISSNIAENINNLMDALEANE